MSQVVSCSRCGLASELRCDLCPDMLPLCRPCANPHYRLFHEMDFNTRTPMPSVFVDPKIVSAVGEGVGLEPLPGIPSIGKFAPKKGRKRSPQRLIQDYIKKMKQP